MYSIELPQKERDALARLQLWIGRPVWVFLVCLVYGVCFIGMAHAVQPDKRDQSDKLNEPVDWDVLPNGLLMVQYDQTGDGVPDHFTLHQITWSGWTAQTVQEIETQAKLDGQRVFIVEYDQDRYVYLTGGNPLLVGDDPQQNGHWHALPVEHSLARSADNNATSVAEGRGE